MRKDRGEIYVTTADSLGEGLKSYLTALGLADSVTWREHRDTAETVPPFVVYDIRDRGKDYPLSLMESELRTRSYAELLLALTEEYRRMRG